MRSVLDAGRMPWSEFFFDDVVEWLRPFQRLYHRHGHDADDIAQEARFALVKAEAHLTKVFEKTRGDRDADGRLTVVPDTRFVTLYARRVALRAVKRRVMGRDDRTPEPDFLHNSTSPDDWDAVFEAQSREANVHIQVELAEAVERAPAEVRMYLSVLLGNVTEFDAGMVEAVTKDAYSGGRLRAAASEYLLNWFAARHHWNKGKKS